MNTTDDTNAADRGSELSGRLGAGSEARQCQGCYGKGWNDARKKVSGHYMGGEVSREECDHCGGSGYAG